MAKSLNKSTTSFYVHSACMYHNGMDKMVLVALTVFFIGRGIYRKIWVTGTSVLKCQVTDTFGTFRYQRKAIFSQ